MVLENICIPSGFEGLRETSLTNGLPVIVLDDQYVEEWAPIVEIAADTDLSQQKGSRALLAD